MENSNLSGISSTNSLQHEPRHGHDGEHDGQHQEQDINAVFDSLANFEQDFFERGFQQGQLVAQRRQQLQGFSVGLRKGCQVGSRVGHCQAFANIWLALIDNQSYGLSAKKTARLRKELTNLSQLAQDVAPVNYKEDTDWQKQDVMKDKYKLICHLLHLDHDKEVGSRSGEAW